MKKNLSSGIRLCLALLMLLASGVVFAARPGEKVGVAVENMVYDFGTIHNDSPNVHHTFTITNNSDQAVAILSASASCGCTKPKYQKKPLKHGETGTIDVTFIPTGQKGEINKDVKVRLKNANGKSETITLRLKGAVVPKK